jgi:carbon-monoxide dehydrogenase medium subunit
VKPPRFDYTAPSTLGEALGDLSAGDGDARPLGGGQSLVPLMNFRLGQPGALVDLGRIPELVGVSVDGAAITVGAMTPTARLLATEVAAASPVLAAAARLVGHPQIRSRGTVGGSIAHADPAAELPAVAVLTEAAIEITGPRGRREVAAEEFFEGLFATACDWDELVTAVRFPRLADRTGWGFREFARRPGDFALAGVGVTLTLAGDAVASIAVVAFGVGATPVRARAAEDALRGQVPTAAVVAQSRAALTAAIDPGDTLHGSGAYRRRITGVLFERAIGDALRTARGSDGDEA